jgi:hypothetical protein
MGVRRAEDYDTTLSVADAVEAADEIERLRAERDEARAYLSRLLQIRHPTVEPLPDLLGVCTQIDNALAGLLAERDRLREAVQWFIDNDETNQGDEPMPEFGGQSWNEINAYWIDGLTRARAALGETGHE